MQQFNNYIPVAYTDTFISNIRDTLETAFWDMFRQELYENPPKMDKFKNTLNEIKNLLLQLDKTPSFNQNVIERLDDNYIADMITHNVYDPADLLRMLEYLGNQVLRLDSPVNDEDNCEAYDKIVETVANLAIQNSNISNREIICEGWICIFKFMIPKFKEILELKNLILNETK